VKTVTAYLAGVTNLYNNKAIAKYPTEAELWSLVSGFFMNSGRGDFSTKGFIFSNNGFTSKPLKINE
jgi:hypothetical protein